MNVEPIDDDLARAELADLRRRLALARGDEEAAEIARIRKDLKRIEGNLRRFADRRRKSLGTDKP